MLVFKIFKKISAMLRVVCPESSFEIFLDDFSAPEHAYTSKIHMYGRFLISKIVAFRKL